MAGVEPRPLIQSGGTVVSMQLSRYATRFRSVGIRLVLVLFAAMRERLAVADVPIPFQGAAIGMVTAGLMSLAFMGFAGLGAS